MAPALDSQAAETTAGNLDEGEPLVEGRIALKRLGGGRRYEAYLVWDEALFSLAVAKVLRPGQVPDGGALRDLRREAEVVGALAHPVLVRAFDAVLEGPRPHLLLEHLEGPSLRRLIRRGGPLPLAQLLPLALHVAGGLAYMARADYVHLDVKPDNLIVGVPPRIIDLSIARTAARAARTSGPVGTDAYMSPEQCVAGGAPIGPAADVWGLGATLFHAATGRRPFPRPEGARESEVESERFPQLLDEPPPLEPNLPADLAELIAAMLDREPGRRPSAAEVAHRLEPLVAARSRRPSRA